MRIFRTNALKEDNEYSGTCTVVCDALFAQSTTDLQQLLLLAESTKNAKTAKIASYAYFFNFIQMYSSRTIMSTPAPYP